MTRFIDVSTLRELVGKVGVSQFIAGMTQTVREDFMRWEDFDKSPRSAAHSEVGVIELMPVANAQHYAFKYVNGHPGNTALGMSTVMALSKASRPMTADRFWRCSVILRTAARSTRSFRRSLTGWYSGSFTKPRTASSDGNRNTTTPFSGLP